MSGDDEGKDILELGSSRRPFRWRPPARWRRPPAVALILGLTGLLIGLGAGYAGGTLNTRKHAAPPAVSGTAGPSGVISLAFGGYPLGESGPQCFAQTGSRVQLGVEIMNVSSTPATLTSVIVVLPLGGLKVISHGWGPCGELPLPVSYGAPGTALAAGASTWFTVTFQVLLECPGPLPVKFILDYTQKGRPETAHLPGFNDLSQVPYSGCGS